MTDKYLSRMYYTPGTDHVAGDIAVSQIEFLQSMRERKTLRYEGEKDR